MNKLTVKFKDREACEVAYNVIKQMIANGCRFPNGKLESGMLMDQLAKGSQVEVILAKQEVE